MRTPRETAAAILERPRGVLVADEYAESIDAGRASNVPDLVDIALHSPQLAGYISAVLVTERAFAARDRGRATPLLGVRLASPQPGSQRSQPTIALLAEDGAAFVECRANLRPLDVPRGNPPIDADALAIGAATAQAAGVLPMITVAMPDIGSESITVNEAVTTNSLRTLRRRLQERGADPEELLLRVNPVAPGTAYVEQSDPESVARATLRVLERCVPEGVPGVLLLSGGRPLDQAASYLAATTALAAEREAPWAITFGFSRPLFGTAAESMNSPSMTVGEAADHLVRSCRVASEALGDAGVSLRTPS